jgi:hypothetical protein
MTLPPPLPAAPEGIFRLYLDDLQRIRQLLEVSGQRVTVAVRLGPSGNFSALAEISKLPDPNPLAEGATPHPLRWSSRRPEIDIFYSNSVGVDLARSGVTFHLPEPLSPDMHAAFNGIRDVLLRRRWLFAVRSWKVPAYLGLIALFLFVVAAFEGSFWWRVAVATAGSTVATGISYLLTGCRGRIRIVGRNAPAWAHVVVPRKRAPSVRSTGNGVTASPASVSPALRRRAIRHLHRARVFWAPKKKRICGAIYLTDQQRHMLKPLVRRWSVRSTAVPRMRYAQLVIVVVAGVVCLLGPVAVVAGPAVRALSPGGLLFASMIYLSIFGALSTCYFRWVGRPPRILFILGILGTGTSIVTASIAAALVLHPWKALQFGIVAGVLAVPIIALVMLAWAEFATYIVIPLRHRYVATLPPSVTTAAQLWLLTDQVNDATVAWRKTSTRRDLLTHIRRTAYILQWRMPRAMRMAGYHRPAFAEAVRRYQRAASFVREQAWRVMDANDRASFESIRTDLAEEAIAVGQGDWASLPAAPERTSGSRMSAVARRLVTAIFLAGVALLLPHLPYVRLSGSALTSLQVALFAGAVLSLTPIDASSREQIIGAFPERHHRN